MKNKELDLILKEWDKKTIHSSENTSKIKEDILKEIEKQPKLILKSDEHFIVHKTLVYWGSVAAIFSIVSLVIFFNQQNDSLEKNAILSTKDIAELKQINKEMKILFPNGVDWINNVNNDINIHPAKSAISQQQQIVVRHIVFKFNNGKWDKIVTSDIITNSNKELVLDNQKIKGYLWTCQADNNIFAVESQLTINTGSTILKIESYGGHKTEEPQKVKVLNDKSSQYKVFQTIVKI